MINMSVTLQYRKIKISPENEARMLDVLLSTDQRFKAVSTDEYLISTAQCDLLAKKIFRINLCHFR